MATTVKCQECRKRINNGYSLGPDGGGKGKLYIPMFNCFCTGKCLMKSVSGQIERFDLEDD